MAMISSNVELGIQNKNIKEAVTETQDILVWTLENKVRKLTLKKSVSIFYLKVYFLVTCKLCRSSTPRPLTAAYKVKNNDTTVLARNFCINLHLAPGRPT